MDGGFVGSIVEVDGLRVQVLRDLVDLVDPAGLIDSETYGSIHNYINLSII